MSFAMLEEDAVTKRPVSMRTPNHQCTRSPTSHSVSIQWCLLTYLHTYIVSLCTCSLMLACNAMIFVRCQLHHCTTATRASQSCMRKLVMCHVN